MAATQALGLGGRDQPDPRARLLARGRQGHFALVHSDDLFDPAGFAAVCRKLGVAECTPPGAAAARAWERRSDQWHTKLPPEPAARLGAHFGNFYSALRGAVVDCRVSQSAEF